LETVREIIAAMQEAAPKGREQLDEPTLDRLRALTQSLLAASADTDSEYQRFLGIQHRSLGLPGEDMHDWLGGKTVLVTGGTGCVGSMLMRQLASYRPRRLICLSRGVTGGWPCPDGSEFAQADVRDARAVRSVVGEIKPDVLFHVAAQRDPGLAEHEVHRTVTTNVLGARNVIAAAEGTGVPMVVTASTGKALRPYSPDVYTASKRVAEWVVSAAAARGGTGTRYASARFTHVVDNSIIHRRLRGWAADGGPIRLHSTHILFYAQSALESAQLLLCAGLGAHAGSLRVHALSDLGWPINLLDMALGVLRETGSATPIYFSGYDSGYEDVPFPGLYDPDTAGDVSPLMSALEADGAQTGPCRPADAFPLVVAPEPGLDDMLAGLETACEQTQQPAAVRAALDTLSWAMFDAVLRATPARVLARATLLTAPHRGRLNPQHLRMLAAFERYAAEGSPGQAKPDPVLR
jgi:nucleoside-diphosphate-sugar epimerase